MSGIVAKADKCLWIQVQILYFLGVTLNAKDGCISIPKSRLDKASQAFISLLPDFKVHRRIPVRKFASVVGQIISSAVVIGSIAHIISLHEF